MSFLRCIYRIDTCVQTSPAANVCRVFFCSQLCPLISYVFLVIIIIIKFSYTFPSCRSYYARGGGTYCLGYNLIRNLCFLFCFLFFVYFCYYYYDSCYFCTSLDCTVNKISFPFFFECKTMQTTVHRCFWKVMNTKKRCDMDNQRERKVSYQYFIH